MRAARRAGWGGAEAVGPGRAGRAGEASAPPQPAREPREPEALRSAQPGTEPGAERASGGARGWARPHHGHRPRGAQAQVPAELTECARARSRGAGICTAREAAGEGSRRGHSVPSPGEWRAANWGRKLRQLGAGLEHRAGKDGGDRCGTPGESRTRAGGALRPAGTRTLGDRAWGLDPGGWRGGEEERLR